MISRFTAMVAVSFALFALGLSTTCYAEYNAPAIIATAIGSGGEVYVRFAGLPNPAPSCGGASNNGWVVIPSAANEAIKAFAISLYFSGRPIRVDTSGCTGAYENVTVIYSPGG